MISSYSYNSFKSASEYVKQTKQLTMNCNFCNGYLVVPTQTECGHIFCNQCIEEYLLFLPNCPVCEKYLSVSRYRNYNIQSIILDYLQAKDKEQYQVYKAKTLARKAFLKALVFTPKKGDFIDVQDSNRIWCQAQLLQITTKIQSNPEYTIRYKDQLQQSISTPQRIAPLNTFTSRKDIPHYEKKKIVFYKNGKRHYLKYWSSVRPDEETKL